MRYCVVIAILLFIAPPRGLSQDGVELAYSEFIQNIVQFHPVARQAALKVKFGAAELLKAKGSFDPALTSDWSEKNFNEKLYYRQFGARVKIPTPIGLDVVGGYNYANGDYLNPENNTSSDGLWHIGLELDVLQGLLVNERKTALQQARVYQEMARNEQQVLLNELMFNASASYLQWQLYFNYDRVLQDNLTLAQNYFDNARQLFFGGEKTAMDTLEAFILFQDAILELRKNEMELVKSRMSLENYLWFEDNPIALQADVVPEPYQNDLFGAEADWSQNASLERNPSIQASLNKLSILELDQKLKREKLKPKLKVKYNPLISSSNGGAASIYSVDNFTWGFGFAMPLLLRKERAGVQQGNIKIMEQQLEIDNKRNELQNKIENSWQQQALLGEQQTLLEQNANNYRLLLEGENEKFRLGESSVFLLNKRQEKYIIASLKLISNRVKRQSEWLKFLYYTNQLI
ncbi:MAG: TolC family protein [Saprospiraceae bacterium]